MNKREVRKPQTCIPGGLGATLRGMDFNKKTVGGHGRLGNATCSGLCHQVRGAVPLAGEGGGERC